MPLRRLFQLSDLAVSAEFDSDNYVDIKPWIKTAIAEEDQRIREQSWKGERSSKFLYEERSRIIRLFRKYEDRNPQLKRVADRLRFCERGNRCCSGACPECGSLLQRSFVRKSKALISDAVDKGGHSLVAITIIPAKPIIRPGELHRLDIRNLLRRLKYALDKAGIDLAIGAFDFSFNEDRNGRYDPFWSAHYYMITSVANKARTRKILKRFFSANKRIARPVKLTAFNNSPSRRSYAFKTQFNRRVGVDAINYKKADGSTRKCRNTSRQRLRAAERLELYTYLDRIGFAERFIFRNVKPVIRATKVKLGAIET